VGYPLLAALIGRLRPQKVRRAAYEPSVSLLIAAYNEAAAIEATLRNKFELDYPPEKLEILVVSDESDDGTDAIVERLAEQAPCPVRLVRQVPRQGKTAGLNRLAPMASGDILLFSDANSLYQRGALRALVANFADPAVGYVTGKMVYVNPDGSMVGDGCTAYMRFENWLREQETRMGSIVGVDGGIDAMRRRLYQPLAPDQLPDFVQPLKVVEQGYRVVYEPAALLEEPTTATQSDEYRMRVRVTLRALWALKDMSALLRPGPNPLFALQLWSHKLLRYLAFVPLALLPPLNVLLLASGALYVLAAVAQLVFYGAAWAGYRRREQPGTPPWVSVPYYFGLINLACADAARAFLRGEKKVIWTPRAG
jgi:cellulose synthase/poly-beta-1,6-N-acetylglucosamine synthase-like glycosyltransferase